MNIPALGLGYLKCRTTTVKLCLVRIFMTSKSVILFAGLAIITSLGVLSAYIFDLERVFEIEGTSIGPFVARVKLETNCEITDDAFSVKNLSTNVITPFRHGEAFVRANPADEVKLVVSENFPEFEINSTPITVSGQLVLFHECEPPSLGSIFDSMNKQFGVKGGSEKNKDWR